MTLVTEGQPPAPGYFVYDAILNRKDRDLFEQGAPVPQLSHERAAQLLADGAMLIDVRAPEEFALGHLVGAVNVGLDGRYAEYAGSIVPSDVDIVLFAEEGTEREAVTRLARIGFDRVVGTIDRPLQTLIERPDLVQRASRLTATELDERRRSVADIQLVDVRNPGEVEGGSIPGAVTIPVGQLPGRATELDPGRPTVVFCAGGYRSSVAASALRARGFGDVSDLIGGYSAWTDASAQAPVPA